MDCHHVTLHHTAISVSDCIQLIQIYNLTWHIDRWIMSEIQTPDTLPTPAVGIPSPTPAVGIISHNPAVGIHRYQSHLHSFYYAVIDLCSVAAVDTHIDCWQLITFSIHLHV